MFYDDLFAALDAELKTATKNIKQLDSKLNTTKKKFNIVTNEELLPKTYKHVEKQGPSYGFTKSQRFLAKKNDPLNETQASYASFSTNPSLDSVKTKGPSIVFAKSQRFLKEKNELEEDAFELNPNFDFNKKKCPSLVVYKPKVQNILDFSKQKEEEREENYEPGPGNYDLNYEAIDKKTHLGVFPKGDRFEKQENNEMQDITPNYDAVKPKVKTVMIKKSIEKNDKLKQKERFNKFLAIISAKYRQNKPIDNDKPLRNHISTAFIAPPPTSQPNKKTELIKFFHLIDKINELRRRGPGEYNLQRNLEGPCMVVYRSCSPVFPNPLKNKRPAPNQYNVNDELIKESQPKYTFKKSPKQKKLKFEDLDWKKPLNIDQKAVKSRVPNALILPEKKHKNLRRALSDMKANRLGPGRYDLIFDLVEAREDKGVVPYKLTRFNDRAVQMDPVPKDLFDLDLDPNYDYNKPRKPEFKYYEDFEWYPPHPSDAMLFKERWRFYDYDINRVRPEIKPVDFAKNLNIKEFLAFEYEFKLLEDYLQRRKKVPESGQYNVDFKQIDKNVQGFDMEKMKDREEKENEIKDELILNPEKPKPKIPTLDFEKQVGREEKDIPDNDQLILNPTYEQIDKKITGFVEFDKFVDRKEQEPKQNNTEELILEPKYDYTEAKIKGNAEFGKIVSRDDHPINKINVREEECVINPSEELVKPHIGNVVQMDKGAQRFTNENKEKDGQYYDKNNQLTDVVQAYEALKPEKNAMKFDGYSGREKTKIKISTKPNSLYKERKKENKK